MRLFEYEGKQLFSKYGIPVPRSELAATPAEAVAAAGDLGYPAVFKAQVLSGGRGKAGGVAVVATQEAAEEQARRILSLTIAGERPRSLLVEKAFDHTDELYLSVSLDRSARQFVALASPAGGMDVEAQRDRMLRAPVPLDGLSRAAAEGLTSGSRLPGDQARQLTSILMNLERLSREEECELAEINPLAVGRDGSLVALDSKIVLDDNALFRHPEFSQFPPEDPLEGKAAAEGFAFVKLGGAVAVVGNGAGLVLSTLDLVADAGGTSACFLDLGGGAQEQRVEAALELAMSLPGARAVVLNIFGGITETTDIARGLERATKNGRGLPVFARIRGAGEDEANRMLTEAGTPHYSSSMEAVRAAVAEATKKG
jgi:succinyl-CoA synthetase beta subunit